MGFTQLESKKIVEACLQKVARTAKNGKRSGEERLCEIKLHLQLVDSVLSDTEKRKKKKNKKRKLSAETASTSSVEIVESSK